MVSEMCDLFGTKAAASAAAAQQAQLTAQQKKHDDAVTQGKQSIDDNFAQFTPAYYDKYGQTYKDTYNPQLDDQYKIANDQLTATLAGRDQLDSTVGANARGQLGKTYATNQAQIGNSAIDAENALKSNVANTQTNLYSMNSQTADPLSAAAMSQAQAGALVAPNAMPSLGNAFAGALSPFASGVKSNQGSMQPYQYQSLNAPIGGGGGDAVYSG